MNIEQQCAVVTGGGSGLGEATARALTAAGAKVAVLDIDESRANLVAGEIGGLAFKCDITSETDVEKVLDEVTARWATPRICVSCAGIGGAARIVGRDGPMPLQNFRAEVEVNLVGTFNMLRLTAARMMALDPLGESGERGVVVNTASIAAFEGQIGQSPYAASKAGIVGLTLPAAREFAKSGIRVMTIAPGLFTTPMWDGTPDAVYEGLDAQMQFPRRFGLAGEFAQLVSQIVENPMLNGEVIRLDGALRMPAR